MEQALTSAAGLCSVATRRIGVHPRPLAIFDDGRDERIYGDTATIMRRLDVRHPAALAALHAIEAQAAEFGFGATSLAALVSCLCIASRRQLAMSGADCIGGVLRRRVRAGFIRGLERAAEDAITHLRDSIATSMPELSIPDSTALSSGSKQALVDGNAFPDDVQWFFSHGSDSATEIDTKIVDDGIQLLGSFKIGDLVRLHGLQSKRGSAWNGCRGVVIGHAHSVGRLLIWARQQQGCRGSAKRFRPTNVRLAVALNTIAERLHRCGDASVLEAVVSTVRLLSGHVTASQGVWKRAQVRKELRIGPTAGPMVSKAVLVDVPAALLPGDMRQLWRAQGPIGVVLLQEDLDASRNRPLDALHVETDATEFIIQTQLTRAERDAETYAASFTNALSGLGVGLLITSGSVDACFQAALSRARVVLLRHVSKADLAQVATVAGVPVLSTDTRPRREHVGRVRVVPHTDLGRARHAAIAHASIRSRNGICILISSCVSSDQTPALGTPAPGPVTVVLCRPAEAMLEQWEAGFRSLLGRLRECVSAWLGNHQEQKQNACSLRILVPGAGATEICCALHLRRFAPQLSGVESAGYRSLSHALLAWVRTALVNHGVPASDAFARVETAARTAAAGDGSHCGMGPLMKAKGGECSGPLYDMASAKCAMLRRSVHALRLILSTDVLLLPRGADTYLVGVKSLERKQEGKTMANPGDVVQLWEAGVG